MLPHFDQWREKLPFARLVIVALVMSTAALLTGCDKLSAKSNASGAMPDADHHAAEMNMKTTPGANPVADSPTAPNQVVIDNFTFNPSTLTVAVGTKVTWINRDDVPHTATSAVKPRVFDSKTLDTDEKFSFVFTTPGTYKYFCAVHPHMTGEIVVK